MLSNANINYDQLNYLRSFGVASWSYGILVCMYDSRSKINRIVQMVIVSWQGCDCFA